MRFTVAIVGRPNVGKSTLFNRLVGRKKSIVDDISGVTRDRIYDVAEWNGKKFYIVDTGGFVAHSSDIFESQIRRQVELAIVESSAIIYMVDVTTGITDLDEFVAQLLRRVDKKKFLVVNKVDNHERLLLAQEFWSLGFDEMYCVSGMTGSGTGELLDAIAELIPSEELVLPDLPKFAIIGQPNVGKSSLINALLDEERNMVTDIAGTTRDPIHSEYNKFGKQFIIIDTAGIRKKAKVHEDLEFYSVIRAFKSIEEADVCFLVIDATLGIESQDMELVSLVIKRNKGLVILVNKWDLVEKITNTAKEYEQTIKNKMAPFNDVPILFISAKEKQRVFQAIEKGLEVYKHRSQKIKTSDLNEKMLEAIGKIPPPSYRNHLIKIKYITQIEKEYPLFAFFSNYPDEIKGSYKQFLENQLRSLYNFTGVPIRLLFKEK
ncbi:MAG: ribosome biogenesis GTPase Der [Saprospiraceae bacterium]|nr:ribosome biogenesis GTPase Der [Candidatus Vicinibacter affinis]MBP6173154.1 ribosome biogenesis GTPase Der [Saprospiraceae bacterium]MBK7305301.1 ribosome biogenesis GTPase Der [Candidatus Vicinibacter affinis]MBK7693648.1 ribosome biogenesis GTPase Der [Candidatus Vicinibacter affinis]MBK7799296.1 ribosome biogenesis GTPase Der [Candidatus Vicinibacter affinis]